MKVIWERERVTVRTVYEALLERRKVAYTTVMTMMKILEQKKYLRKTQTDRAYVYRPAQPKGQVVGDMVRASVNRAGRPVCRRIPTLSRVNRYQPPGSTAIRPGIHMPKTRISIFSPRCSS